MNYPQITQITQIKISREKAQKAQNEIGSSMNPLPIRHLLF